MEETKVPHMVGVFPISCNSLAQVIEVLKYTLKFQNIS